MRILGAGATGDERAAGSMRRRARLRRYSIRTNLIALVAACLVPAVLVSAFLVHANYRLQREQVDRDTLLMARSLAAALDRELAVVESGLRVLATSPALAAGDLASFHERARSALEFQPVDNYILTDRSGRQLLNTLRAYGEPVPSVGTPAALERVFTEGRAVLTDLFVGPVTGAPVIAMGVPVYRGGEIVYSLNVGMAPRRVAAILQRQAVPPGWITSVLDSAGTIVARNPDLEHLVGQQGAAGFLAGAQGQREAVLETLTLEGVAVYAGLSRSSLSNWSVIVAEPTAQLDAVLRRSIAWVVLGTAAALGLGGWIAARLSRRVRASVAGLVEPARSLGSGRPVEFSHSRLLEAEAVGQAIAEASRMLQRTRHLAHHDPLTGLPNRLLFDEMVANRIAHTRRHGGRFALLAIDLDGFKAVNDRYGHATGDRVLTLAAQRIRSQLRESDLVARMGGDEFVVLLDGAGVEEATQVGAKLVGALAQPYPEVECEVSGSVGVALCPQPGRGAAELLASADRALYKAKQSGKRCVQVDA